MSAPGVTAVESTALPTENHPKTKAGVEVKLETQRSFIDTKLFTDYKADFRDHVLSDPILGVGACQIKGLRDYQQDCYRVTQLDDKKFPTTPAAVEKLILDAWKKVKKPFGRGIYQKEGGTTGILAISHGRKLYVSHVGDSSAYLIVRNKKNELVYLTQLQFRKHKPSEPSESIRYKKSQLNGERLIADGYEIGMTRSIGDVGADVLQIPDYTVYDLEEIPSDYVLDLLLVSDGVTDALSEEKIKQVFQSFETGIPLPKQAEILVQKALKAGSKDNITALLVSLSNGINPKLNPRLAGFGDGHATYGQEVASQVVNDFHGAIHEPLTSPSLKETPEQKGRENKKEILYRETRLTGQQFILNPIFLEIDQSSMKSMTKVREGLKKAISEKWGYIFECRRSKISIQHDANTVLVKETSYCTFDKYEELLYNAKFSAQLDVLLLSKLNEEPKIHALLTVQGSFAQELEKQKAEKQKVVEQPLGKQETKIPEENKQVVENVSHFNYIESFTNSRFKTVMQSLSAWQNSSNPVWGACLDAKQTAEVQSKAQHDLVELWGKQPLAFLHYVSFLSSYDGWLKKFFAPENKVLHEQIVHYQQVCFSLNPFHRFVLLSKIIRALSLESEENVCWNRGNSMAYSELIKSLTQSIYNEQLLVTHALSLPSLSGLLPAQLPLRAADNDKYSTCFQSHWEKILCCFLGIGSASFGLPFLFGNGAAASFTGPIGTILGGLGGGAVNKAGNTQLNIKAKVLAEKLDQPPLPTLSKAKVKQVSQATTEVKKNNTEQGTKLEAVKQADSFETSYDPNLGTTAIIEYLQALRTKNVALRERLLKENNQNILNGLLVLMNENPPVLVQNLGANINPPRSQLKFEAIVRDDVFKNFVIEHPQAAVDFTQRIDVSAHKREYKSFIATVDTVIYGIMYPQDKEQMDVPGVIPGHQM